MRVHAIPAIQAFETVTVCPGIILQAVPTRGAARIAGLAIEAILRYNTRMHWGHVGGRDVRGLPADFPILAGVMVVLHALHSNDSGALGARRVHPYGFLRLDAANDAAGDLQLLPLAFPSVGRPVDIDSIPHPDHKATVVEIGRVGPIVF